jgi:hypothetical protein
VVARFAGAPHRPAVADAGAAAVDAGVAQRQADGSIVFAPPAGEAGASTPSASGGVAAPVVAQRQPDEPAAPEAPASSPVAPAPAAGASTPPPGSPAPATTPAELDELARRLWRHVRTELRNELRLDRERAGGVLDPR